jgi:hypothetical protein
MGASVILMFEKGEIKKVKDWFVQICPAERYPDLPVPESPYREKENTRGIYVEFSRNIMELDRAIWDNIAGCYATFIGQELGKRLKLKKAGWDSVGYCDKIENFMKASGLLSWKYKEIAENQSEHPKVIEAMKKEAEWRAEAEKFFRDKAVELIGNHFKAPIV